MVRTGYTTGLAAFLRNSWRSVRVDCQELTARLWSVEIVLPCMDERGSLADYTTMQ